MARFAWVTLATNDSYSLGALVLAHSLKKVNTAHELVVLITPGVTEAMKTQLSAVFNVVKLVDVLDSKDADNLALLARPELGITFTKLHCWKLTEYEKCVFLDADTLVLQNSDELFEREELSAAPDAGWPDCFNSGVFVFKPSKETFQALIEFALIHGSFDGGDQGLLNLFFSDWATKDIKKHLPFVYNMCSTATYSYLPAFKQFGAGLKIIHFIGAAKPWLQPFNTETGLASVSGTSQHLVQFVQLWWDIFCAHVHPSLSTEMAGLAGALATVTLGAPLTAEQRALEEHLRRQGWEQGNIDYMGKDSFANIWQKICETLASGTQQSTPSAPLEEARAPVAPVAAPVYVSSVEISPSGQIDKTPPQANYAPVSALEPTVETSDAKDASKATPSEAATVASEPISSFTEIGPTESSATPIPGSETSAATPQVTSVSSQPAETVESTPTPVSESVAPVGDSTVPTETSTPATSPPSNETLITYPEPAPVILEASKSEAISSPSLTATSTAESSPASVETSAVNAIVVTSAKQVTVPESKETSVSEQILTPSSTESPVLPPSQKETSVATAPVSLEGQVLTTSAETPTSTSSSISPSKEIKVPSSEVSTPSDTSALPDSTFAPSETTVASSTVTEASIPAPAPPIDTSVLPPAPTETSVSPSSPIETSVSSPSSVESSVSSPVSTETLVSSPAPTESSVTTPGPDKISVTTPGPEKTPVPSSIPTETPVQSGKSPTPLVSSDIQSSTPTVSTPSASAPAETPILTSSVTISSAPVSTEIQSSASLVSPSAPVSTPIPVSTPVDTSPGILPPTADAAPESITPKLPAEEAKAGPVQPQTPTVTEPTPPTSPPIATEAPQLTSLQVESEVPATPPVGSSTQPSLAEATGDEPPVPPKRKGGSKAPQDSKNQKGGKPSKGKK